MDRFVVGTGRCGSTLLSRMLGENPDVLSLFEYLNGLDVARRFAPEPISGAAFGELISAEQPFVSAVLRRGYTVPEITYPFERGRRRPDQPLPWILVSLLPPLTEDPDALLEDLMRFVRRLPTQPVVAQHRALFDWLRERRGARCWIERSGSSIDYLGELSRHFPDARFLHLHRDGHEAALSMREHHAYRLPIAVLQGAVEAPAVTVETLRAPPSDHDPISRILASRPPVELYGRYWSQQIERGLAASGSIPPTRYQEVRFEKLVSAPRETLLAISEFFELDPSTDLWLERAAKLVRGVPPTRFEALPRPERDALAEACRPGQELLGR